MYFLLFFITVPFFSNKQTRKQPKSTEGSTWMTFFVDKSHPFCVCGELCCALLEWRQGAHALYLHKCVLLFPSLPQGEDGTITVQQCQVQRRGKREGRTIRTKFLSDKSSPFLCLIVSLNKTSTPGQQCKPSPSLQIICRWEVSCLPARAATERKLIFWEFSTAAHCW